jgi:hypothetical protein
VFNVDTVDPFGPRISIAGIGRFGREFTNPSDRIHHRYQVVDNWSFLRGRHNFKAGVDLSRFTFTGYGPTFLGGEIDFARLPVPAGAALGESATTQLATLLATPSDSGGLGRADLISVLTAEPMTVIQQNEFRNGDFHQSGLRRSFHGTGRIHSWSLLAGCVSDHKPASSQLWSSV